MPTYDVPTNEGTVRVTADSPKQATELALKGGGMLLPKGSKPAAGLPQAETVYNPGGLPAASQPTDLNILIGGQQPTPPQEQTSTPVAPSPEYGGLSNPPGLVDTLVTGGLKYGLPAGAAYLTGGASYPVQLGGQLAATGLQQVLGVEPREGLEPYAETVIADLLGRGAYGAGREVLRSLVGATPAGKQFLANRERDALRFRLDRQMDASDFEQEAFQKQIDRAIGKGMQEQEALDESLRRFGTATQADIKAVGEARRKAEEGFGLVKTALEHTGDNIRRMRQFQQEQVRTVLPAKGAVDARSWLSKYPVPSDEVLAGLYGEVDKFNGQQLPASVLDGLAEARAKLAAKEARIASVLPEASNPALRKLGGTVAQEGADVAPQLTNPSATAARGGLGKANPQELELQDFLRQPDKQGRWGINLNDDELFSGFDALLGKAESGSARLKNQNGLTSSAQAQRAHEQGFIDSPDVDALKQALDESIAMGRPVYSKFRSYADIDYGLTPEALGPNPTFQALRETISRLGQRIGDARAGVNTGQTGAREQLAALSSMYGALQKGMALAEESGELTPAAREALKKANAAFKVRATMDDLAGLIESKIRTPAGGAEVFNAGQVLDALRKPQNKDLRAKLDEIGILPQLESFLDGLQGRIANAKDALAKARELDRTAKGLYKQMSQDEQVAVQRYMDAQQGMQERLTAARAGVGEETAAIGQQAEARAGMLKSDAQTALQGAKEAQETTRRKMASIQSPSFNDALTFGYLPAAVGAMGTLATGDYVTGAKMAAPFFASGFLVRALMTPKGQEMVGKVLEASGGIMTPAAVVVLSQIAKDPTMQFGAEVGKYIKESTVGR